MISQLLEIRAELNKLQDDMTEMTLSETIIGINNIIKRIDVHIDRYIETFDEQKTKRGLVQ